MRKIFVLLLIICVVSCTDPPNLKRQLENLGDTHQLMGMSVILIQDGEITEAYHSGTANLNSGVPNGPDIKYRIASISKTVTSIAVMQLWEKGLVDLDLDVSTYLGWTLRNPAFPDHIITLRHLMNHTSGIRDGEGYGSFLAQMKEDQLDIRELFHRDGIHFTPDMFSDKKPGDYFSYTNCTWGMIAGIVEKVSGQKFDDYCGKNIFDPMGLTCSFNVMDIPKEKMGALYRFKEGQWVAQVDDFSDDIREEQSYNGYIPGTNGLIYGPQGSLRASSNDLAQIALMFLNDGAFNANIILKPETIDFMLENPWVYDGENGDTWGNFWFGYGLGLQRIGNHANGDIVFPDRNMIGHPGIAYGLLSDMYFDPETQSGIVFVTNGSKNSFEYAENSSFYQVEADVFELLFGHLKSTQ